MTLVNIIGLLIIEETMISPQEPNKGMSNEEYAKVASGEKYWREKIATDIWLEFDGDDKEVWLSEVLSRCADIARGEA